MLVARALVVSRAGKLSGFTTPASRAVGAVQSAQGVGGRGRKIFVLATCLLQFAKATSAATLPQQQNNDSADLQRSRVNITDFICTVASWPSRRCTFDELELLVVASRWARHRWRMFRQLLCRLRLRHKTSARASGGPAGDRRAAACLGRWRESPCAARHAAFNDHIFAGSLFLNSSATRNIETWS
jgi:hypothetical protein